MIGNTYTVTGKNTDVLWQFEYDSDGHIVSFKFLNGKLDETQERWLFKDGKFPYNEAIINMWQRSIKNFIVEKGTPDLSFDRFYNMYDVKQKRLVAQKLWEKLSDRDKMDAMAYIKRYNDWLKRSNGIAKQLPDTYLRQKRWLD